MHFSIVVLIEQIGMINVGENDKLQANLNIWFLNNICNRLIHNWEKFLINQIIFRTNAIFLNISEY